MSLHIEPQGDRAIVVTRTFHAPRALVFRALMEPELVQRWHYVNDWKLAVCEIDAQVGGRLRYVWRNSKGKEMGMSGTFLEIAPPERTVATAMFDEAWYPGKETTTTTLTEAAGVTTMTLSIAYDSAEAREAVLKTGAMSGLGQGYDQLAELLGTLV